MEMDKKQKTTESTVRTILIMLFSLLCSLLLWVYVTDTEGKEIDYPLYGVQVRFDGVNTMRESRGLIVSDTITNSVNVTLTGSRRVISALKNNAEVSATVDLSNITRTGYYYLAPRITFSGNVDASGVQAEFSPSSVSFYVDVLAKKTIPVQGIFNGSTAEGYAADPLTFNPSTVTIHGPELLLDKVDHAYVEVNRTDLEKTLNFSSVYSLVDADGNEVVGDEITLDDETVYVTLPIRSVKEVSLIVEIIPGGGATESNIKWKLEPDVITLTGDSETLASVNNIVVDRINLADITTESYKKTYLVVIPNNTSILSGSREATLELELGGLATRTFSISKRNMSVINVSTGYSVEIVNDSLENVQIRGPEEALRRVSDVNIRAVANLSEYGNTEGVFNVPVRIEVDGNTDVGAIGEYSISVKISPTLMDFLEEDEFP